MFPTSGGKLLSVDDFGSIFLAGGDLHAPPDHRECAPGDGNNTNMSTIIKKKEENLKKGLLLAFEPVSVQSTSRFNAQAKKKYS